MKKQNKENWEYYADKYNLLLDNENYDDLKKAFFEVAEKVKKEKQNELQIFLSKLISIIYKKRNQDSSKKYRQIYDWVLEQIDELNQK